MGGFLSPGYKKHGGHMRTQDEIVERINNDRSMFNFAAEVLLPYLDFDHAKPFLKEEATRDMWEEDGRQALTKEAILDELTKYMAFAWGKVENHRALSAGRSVEKLSAWVWLLGDDATLKAVEEAGYAQYGAPKLAVICHAYNLPIPGEETVQRMIEGKPCVDGCHEGCGD